MKLPNPDQTAIDDNKLTEYVLNFNHADGQHKARVFKSTLGITIKEIDILKKALIHAVYNYDAIPKQPNQYGQKYLIDFPMTHQSKTAKIRSVWIVKDNENFPHLVTCYVISG